VERVPDGGREGTQRNVAVDASDLRAVAATLGLGVGTAVGAAAREAGVGLAAGTAVAARVGAGGGGRRLLRARLQGRVG
jgi:hypothetical protein